jgi:hypothetical protein
MDYATVHRRQLDVWAALAGFACLTTILFGAADVRRSTRLELEPPDLSEQRPEIVYRQEPVELARDEVRTEALDSVGETIVIVASEYLPPQRLVARALPTQPAYDRGAAGDAASRRDETRPTSAPSVLVEELPEPRGVYTPSLAIDPLASPTPTAGQIVIVATELPEATREPTAPPPTHMPPTDVPPLPATPTPHCGDPEDIDIELKVVEARLDRGLDPLGVRYSAQAHNRSAFPVKLVDILVTIESQDVGAEQFGHEAWQDVAVESGVLYSLEGNVELKKSPSPFGTTQLCVAFVTETCGRSVPYQVTKHCIAVEGF